MRADPSPYDMAFARLLDETEFPYGAAIWSPSQLHEPPSFPHEGLDSEVRWKLRETRATLFFPRLQSRNKLSSCLSKPTTLLWSQSLVIIATAIGHKVCRDSPSLGDSLPSVPKNGRGCGAAASTGSQIPSACQRAHSRCASLTASPSLSPDTPTTATTPSARPSRQTTAYEVPPSNAVGHWENPVAHDAIA